MAGAKFEAVASDEIVLVMWEKWVFLAALAGITCLARAAVRDIVSAGGAGLAAALLDECRAVAAAAGYPPRPDSLKASLDRLTDPRSLVTASMLGDVERRGRTEADHILGDLLRRRGGRRTRTDPCSGWHTWRSRRRRRGRRGNRAPPDPARGRGGAPVAPAPEFRSRNGSAAVREKGSCRASAGLYCSS